MVYLRIYTRTGDQGTTSLVYGKRVAKNDKRVEAYGTCDEANAMIGFAVSFLEQEDWEEKDQFLKEINQIQTVLFHVGAELSTPKDREVQWKLKERHVQELEDNIDRLEADLPPLQNFILPSGHQAASGLHVARTIVRRAERKVVYLSDELNNIEVLAYLNRLSDYLFVAARYINHQLNKDEKVLQVKE